RDGRTHFGRPLRRGRGEPPPRKPGSATARPRGASAAPPESSVPRPTGLTTSHPRYRVFGPLPCDRVPATHRGRLPPGTPPTPYRSPRRGLPATRQVLACPRQCPGPWHARAPSLRAVLSVRGPAIPPHPPPHQAP